MNLNTESRFSLVPQINHPRSKFDLSHSVKTSFNAGQLIPFYCQEVLPGDTFSIDTNLLCRMQPLVSPIMDNLYLDCFYFFVPNRLVWSHWKEFMGENTKSTWYPNVEYNVPHYIISDSFEDANNNSIPLNSIGDYFGVPISYPNKTMEITVSQLPFRALGLIYNEWFRDQNLQDPILVDIDSDSDVPPDYLIKGNPYPVCKYHDYFTSALNEPQKGPDVTIPIGSYAPVVTRDESIDPMYFSGPITTMDLDGFSSIDSLVYTGGYGALRGGTANVSTDVDSRHYLLLNNLYADLANQIGPSVNALRLALATQSFYELNARGGTRYRELLKSHFGVSSPDARQQVPELLSYNRVDININQVVQNSSSVSDSPIGRQAAFSLTADSDNSFTKSFTEHGYVIGVCCARYKHSYQQGLNRMFSRRTMFDYYFPIFANLGEQPILNKELYVYSDDPAENEEVFGYQEAFAEYRYHPDIVTSEMRSGISNSLDVWHLADYYSDVPRLSPEWIEEDSSNVDRTLSITSAVSNQFFADFYIKNSAVRVMPMYSIPGLPRTL